MTGWDDAMTKTHTPTPPLTAVTSSPQSLICVARIMGPHGIKGLMKLKFFGEDITLLAQKNVLRNEKGRLFNLDVKNKIKDGWLVAVEGIHDRTMAEKLGKLNLFLPRDALETLDDDEYYYADLVGLKAINEAGETVGTVIAVDNFGASDVIEIKPDTKPSFMLPFKTPFLVEVKSDAVVIAHYEGML